jgi:archaemetzincin
MKIGILHIGQVDPSIVEEIQENLKAAFPKTTFAQTPETLPIPEEAFDEERQQYRSDIVLSKVRSYTKSHRTAGRTLGVADIDMFSPQLNFVFGQAERPGKAALISLFRLRPEFYRKPPSKKLLVERSTKEAVHELGHTFGLRHCSNPFCVMYSSNSIFETDRKQSLFCNKCYMKIDAKTHQTGRQP